MKRTKIAPYLRRFVLDDYLGACPEAERELRDLLAVYRSAYRMALLIRNALENENQVCGTEVALMLAVEKARARLRRLSAPERGVSPRGSTVKGKSKLPANSRGATRKGAGR